MHVFVSVVWLCEHVSVYACVLYPAGAAAKERVPIHAEQRLATEAHLLDHGVKRKAAVVEAQLIPGNIGIFCTKKPQPNQFHHSHFSFK